MSLVGFKAKNHPQQVGSDGAHANLLNHIIRAHITWVQGLGPERVAISTPERDQTMSVQDLTAIPSTYVYRGQIEEAVHHLLAALEATSDHAPTTGHAEAARRVKLARQNIANIYALSEEGATE